MKNSCQFEKSLYFCTRFWQENKAEIAQLVEHDLAKVGVASSSLVFRSENSSLTYIFQKRK